MDPADAAKSPTRPTLDRERPVSYTHLDVYKRQAVDLGGYQRKYGIDVDADCESDGVLPSCVAWIKPSLAAQSRPTLLVAWGFLVPFVWGFSAKWMTVFLGLKPVRPRLLLSLSLIHI